MSRTSGMFVRRTGASVRSAAHSSGRDAFLAPEMRTLPSRGRPPTTRILSTEASLFRERLAPVAGLPRHQDPGDALQVLHDALDPEAGVLEDSADLVVHS